MAAKSFEQEWSEKVEKVRSSRFWRQVSSPPPGRIEPASQKPGRNEVAIDADWTLTCEGDISAEGPARIGLDDLRRFLRTRFGIALHKRGNGPRLLFQLAPKDGVTRWEAAFNIREEGAGPSLAIL